MSQAPLRTGRNL